MNMKHFQPRVELDEDGVYIATVPEIRGVVDQGETEIEALRNLVSALAFTLWAEIHESSEAAR